MCVCVTFLYDSYVLLSYCFIHNITETGQRFPLRLQNGCLPDQVPLGKQILSAEPYSVCPTAQVKRTLLRTLKFPASLLARAGVPGSPQVPAESPAMGDKQNRSNENKEGKVASALTFCVCVCVHRWALLSWCSSELQLSTCVCQAETQYREGLDSNYRSLKTTKKKL